MILLYIYTLNISSFTR